MHSSLLKMCSTLLAGPDGSFDPVVARGTGFEFQTGSDVCHWGYATTELQNVLRPGVYSGVYSTVH